MSRPRARDDARRDRVAKSERIADGDDPIADPGVARIAELDERQGRLGLDLEQGKIRLDVPSQHLGGKLGIVVENDRDLARALDDMVVVTTNPPPSMMNPDPSDVTWCAPPPKPLPSPGGMGLPEEIKEFLER